MKKKLKVKQSPLPALLALSMFVELIIAQSAKVPLESMNKYSNVSNVWMHSTMGVKKDKRCSKSHQSNLSVWLTSKNSYLRNNNKTKFISKRVIKIYQVQYFLRQIKKIKNKIWKLKRKKKCREKKMMRKKMKKKRNKKRIKIRNNQR